MRWNGRAEKMWKKAFPIEERGISHTEETIEK